MCLNIYQNAAVNCVYNFLLIVELFKKFPSFFILFLFKKKIKTFRTIQYLITESLKIVYNIILCLKGMLVYHCPECAYRFEDREALHEHLEDHKQRPHICDICGASLKRKEHLDRHKQGHNKDRPYQCNMCCKAFKRNEHLARHMITHSGSKNQICTECGKAFYRKDHLKKHLQSHNSSRSKHLNVSQNNQNDQQPSNEELSSFAMIMRQTGPPPFSILRT